VLIAIEPGLCFIPALWERWQSQGPCRDLIGGDGVAPVMTNGGVQIEGHFVIEPAGARKLGSAIPA
jgi:hypothetical protein